VVCERSSSPRPGTPGRGVGGEGPRLTLYLDWKNPGNWNEWLIDWGGVCWNSPHPQPLSPEYQGEGGISPIFLRFPGFFDNLPTSLDTNVQWVRGEVCYALGLFFISRLLNVMFEKRMEL
jgi:hypothetical protein